jgi:ubiquinone/menaquinone biosynthesis C-methylase UbiE
VAKTQLREGEAGLADAYDRWHVGFGSGEDGIGAPWHELAIGRLPQLDGLRVLEIGCGRGGFARYLADRGADLVAADFSPAAVEITNRLLADQERASAVVADVEELQFEDDSFDLVISLDTVEHVPRPEQAVRELVRVTRPGAKVIITTSNYLGLIGLWRLAMKLTGFHYTEMGQPINQPLMLFPRAKLMREFGCDVDVVDGCGHYLRVPRYQLGYLRLNFLERPHSMTKYFGTHRLVVATKLGAAVESGTSKNN